MCAVTPRRGSLPSQETKSGIARRLAGILFAFVAVVAFGDEYAEPVYYVTNPGGSTSNALSECVFTCQNGGVESDSSYAAFNLATAGTLVKRGTGWVTIEEDHSAFTGDVHVEAGVLCCRSKYGLGAAASGDVKVHDGATLYMDSPQAGTKWAQSESRKLTVEGNGVAGLGAALYARYGFSTNDGNWPFLKKATLSGDATFAIDTPRPLYISWWQYFDLASHTLRLKGVNRTRPAMETYSGCSNSSSSPGELILDNMEFRLRDGSVAFSGSSANVLSVTNQSRIIFANVVGSTRAWTLRLDDLWSINLYAASSLDDAAATNMVINNMNIWHGPVVLNCDLKLRKWDEPAKSYVLSLLGPVSGNGGIRSFGGNTPDDKKMILNLANAGNSFSGGVCFTSCSVFLHAPTALPENGGALVLTNGILGLAVPGTFTLPDCNFDGDSRVIGVREAAGQAKSIVKTGAGTLDCGCRVNASRLDVRSGTYRQAPFSWGCVAGLNVYSNRYTTANFDADEPEMVHIGTQTNLLATRMNNAIWGTKSAGEIYNKMFVYRGYVWNRSDSDVTWTFACVADDEGVLKIDGEEVVRNIRLYPKTATVTLTPGAHSFEFRIQNGATEWRGALDYDLIKTFDGNSWTYEGKVAMPLVDGEKRSDLGTWHGDRGFMYKVGSPTYFDTDYSFPVDPGDGSLFTTTTNKTEIAPQYDEASFALGTTLDLNGWCATARSLKGLPTVLNGDLTVSESWTIPVADVVSGGCLAVSGRLTFGDTASVLLEEPELLGRAAGHVVVSASGGLSLPQSLENVKLDPSGVYQLKRVSETELAIIRSPRFYMIFR